MVVTDRFHCITIVTNARVVDTLKTQFVAETFDMRRNWLRCRNALAVTPLPSPPPPPPQVKANLENLISWRLSPKACRYFANKASATSFMMCGKSYWKQNRYIQKQNKTKTNCYQQHSWRSHLRFQASYCWFCSVWIRHLTSSEGSELRFRELKLKYAELFNGTEFELKLATTDHGILSSRCKDGCSITHWGRVTHICVSKLTIIGSDNDLSPDRRQAIIWTNAGILSIGPLGTNSNEISIGIQAFSFKKMHFKMSSAKWRPFCLGLNEIIITETETIYKALQIWKISLIVCHARSQMWMWFHSVLKMTVKFGCNSLTTMV